MSANDWYNPPRELTPEEMMSPWVVTDAAGVTAERIDAYLAVAKKDIGSFSNTYALAEAIRTAWKGHLVDYFVPNKNGAVLLDHLIAFAVHCEGAIKCFSKLAPTAQPNCFISRVEDTPVLVYGPRCFVLQNNQWADKTGVDTTKLNPLADFALKKRYPDVADAYITALKKLSDFRIVVAIDKDYYDKDMGIFERLGNDVRTVVIVLGELTAEQKKAVSKLSDYRETYICEEKALLPVCIGKNRAVFISDDQELCEELAFSGVKVIAVGCKCKEASVQIESGKEMEINSELILRQFVRAERTMG